MGEEIQGIMTLTPSESKRLIARAVAAMPPVKEALVQGKVIVAVGSTNAFVAEELLGQQVSRTRYLAGYVGGGELKTTNPNDRMKPFVLIDGKVSDISPGTIVEQFTAKDVLIKGANAVDVHGHAGVLTADLASGTIGKLFPAVNARGSHLIVPVGLEKLIPSVTNAAKKTGISRMKYATGEKVGLFPLVNATVITEKEALEILTGVMATHVASGGIGGSEGAVTLVVEGSDEEVASAFELIRSIKGEPAVELP